VVAAATSDWSADRATVTPGDHTTFGQPAADGAVARARYVSMPHTRRDEEAHVYIGLGTLLLIIILIIIFA
jgi:hypothetical protein